MFEGAISGQRNRPASGGLRMGRVTFMNPNEPQQPSAGVYRWFYVDGNGSEVSFYVGQAGHGMVRPTGRPSTLLRGVSELRRGGSLSCDDNHLTLDTDFIIGTMIMYLTAQGFDCVWQHVSNNPGEERDISRRFDPILQGETARIQRRFKLRRPDGTPWNNRDPQHVTDAERWLYGLFHQVLP